MGVIYYDFWAVRHLSSDGKTTWSSKTINLFDIESTEYVADIATRLVMRSGDKFIVRMNKEDLGELIGRNTDGYGVLFDFTDKEN